jgi:hypothetical protein
MRRLARTVLACALLAAGQVSAASATSSAPGAALVITVKSVTTASIPRDTAPKGASKGDRIVMRDRLVNVRRQFGKPAGATVGRDEGVLVLNSPTSGTFEGVTTLPGGTIRLHGIVRDGFETFTVTGGTGRYAHARGTISIGSGTSPLNVYRIGFPGKKPVVVV